MKTSLAALVVWLTLIMTPPAFAQTYTSIPSVGRTGPQVTADIDARLSGASPIAPAYTEIVISTAGTIPAGYAVVYFQPSAPITVTTQFATGSKARVTYVNLSAFGVTIVPPSGTIGTLASWVLAAGSAATFQDHASGVWAFLGANGLVSSNNLSDLGNPVTARTNLGLGTASTQNTGTSGHAVPFLDGVNAWAAVNTFSVAPGLSGAGITANSILGTSLANTAVVPGAYTNTNLTVDQQGRITAAANGTAGNGSGFAFNHALSNSPVCTSSSGGSPSNDWYVGTLAANGTPALPNTGCVDNDIISYYPTQGASAFTVTPSTTAVGGLSVVNNGGVCPALGTSAGNKQLYQFKYDLATSSWIETCPFSVPAQPSALVVSALRIGAGPQTFGNTTSPNNYVTGQQIAVGSAVMACHFLRLTCANVFHAATCTTAPTVNVFDGASNIGTPLACSNTLQATRGAISSSVQTLAVSSGDVYGLYISTAGGACLTDEFAVGAELSCP